MTLERLALRAAGTGNHQYHHQMCRNVDAVVRHDTELCKTRATVCYRIALLLDLDFSFV